MIAIIMKDLDVLVFCIVAVVVVVVVVVLLKFL